LTVNPEEAEEEMKLRNLMVVMLVALVVVGTGLSFGGECKSKSACGKAKAEAVADKKCCGKCDKAKAKAAEEKCAKCEKAKAAGKEGCRKCLKAAKKAKK